MEVSGQLHAPAACAWGRKNFGFHWMHPGWPENEKNRKYQLQPYRVRFCCGSSVVYATAQPAAQATQNVRDSAAFWGYIRGKKFALSNAYIQDVLDSNGAP
jgi:hypothetical protein